MLYSLAILFRRIYPYSPFFSVKTFNGGRIINSPVSLSDDLNLSEDITDPTACFFLLASACLIFIYSTRILRFQLIHFHLSPTLRASYTSIDSR